ncbi:MAG: 4Fe-4S binding protein [Thermoplasmata archaeon]|nr:MAG: 4Fe-4S binding protein [Thermoplasmata archaeon]
MTIYVDSLICNGCQVCVDLCPTNALKVVESTCQLIPLLCVNCDACIDRCPTGAIESI